MVLFLPKNFVFVAIFVSIAVVFVVSITTFFVIVNFVVIFFCFVFPFTQRLRIPDLRLMLKICSEIIWTSISRSVSCHIDELWPSHFELLHFTCRNFFLQSYNCSLVKLIHFKITDGIASLVSQ